MTTIEQLQQENAQLRTALATRIIVEQAKGVLIERLDLEPDAVWQLMRSAARRARMNVHELAEEILKSRVSPAYIEREIGYLLESR